MHYFQFNIGDYKSHTTHLDLLEDLAYRRLLDLYYLHERPLNSGVTSVARQINMREHEDKIQTILEEFFQLTEEGWVNVRADREIQHYHGKIEQASRAGKASAQRRLNGRSADVQPNNKQETLTIKQETKKKATEVATPEGVSESVWNDFKAVRKANKAPITQTAMNMIQNEANKIGWTLEQALSECSARGWRGFKADWVADKVVAQRKDLVHVTVPSKMERDPALVKLDQDSKMVTKPNPEVLAKLRELRGK